MSSDLQGSPNSRVGLVVSEADCTAGEATSLAQAPPARHRRTNFGHSQYPTFDIRTNFVQDSGEQEIMPKKPAYNDEDAKDVETTIHDTSCCAISDAEGIGSVKSTADAHNLRRRAFLGANSGYIFATCVMPEHKAQVTHLKRGGWKQLATIKNPNTCKTIVLMGAHTYTAKRQQKPTEYNYYDDTYDYGHNY